MSLDKLIDSAREDSDFLNYVADDIQRRQKKILSQQLTLWSYNSDYALQDGAYYDYEAVFHQVVNYLSDEINNINELNALTAQLPSDTPISWQLKTNKMVETLQMTKDLLESNTPADNTSVFKGKFEVNPKLLEEPYPLLATPSYWGSEQHLVYGSALPLAVNFALTENDMTICHEHNLRSLSNFIPLPKELQLADLHSKFIVKLDDTMCLADLTGGFTFGGPRGLGLHADSAHDASSALMTWSLAYLYGIDTIDTDNLVSTMHFEQFANLKQDKALPENLDTKVMEFLDSSFTPLDSVQNLQAGDLLIKRGEGGGHAMVYATNVDDKAVVASCSRIIDPIERENKFVGFGYQMVNAQDLTIDDNGNESRFLGFSLQQPTEHVTNTLDTNDEASPTSNLKAKL